MSGGIDSRCISVVVSELSNEVIMVRGKNEGEKYLFRRTKL